MAFAMSAVVTWVIAIAVVVATGGNLGRSTVRSKEATAGA
jgi:hypothetical protein